MRPFIFSILFPALLLPVISPVNPLSAAVVRGVILDGESHNPVEYANLEMEELGLKKSADSHGFFSFPDISQGDYHLHVSRVGYRMLVESFSVPAGRDTVNLYLHLFPLPFRMSPIVVAVEHPNTELDDLREKTGTLRGKELQRDMGQTLAATLKNETNLAMRSMGPAPARPVIRGYSGDRVTISEDGLTTADLSATSPDHAVTVEPFTIERIEVIRGPRQLLRGSSTVGGVVNVVRGEVPEQLPEHLTGNLGAFGESANDGFSLGAVAEAPAGPLAFRLELSDREAGDLKTPEGRLPNSDLRTTNWSVGASIPKPAGFIGAAFREFSTEYGIPGGFVGAHPNGVDIEMLKRRVAVMSGKDLPWGTFHNLEADFSRTYYHHTEYESNGSVGSEFLIYNYQGHVNLNHGQLGIFDNGTWGVEGRHRSFEVGGYVFTPNSVSNGMSAYLFESRTVGDFDFQLGARLNYDSHDPDQTRSSSIGPIEQRDFTTLSLSATALKNVAGNLFAGVNLSRTTRTPTLEELYSSGPHLAAYSYEVGNPQLKSERGVGLELFSYYKTPILFANVTFFYNDFGYFISARNTGQLNYQTLLPVYASSGGPATVTGVEGEMMLDLSQVVQLQANMSYTRGEDDETGLPLPMIPPFKGRIEIRHIRGPFTWGVSTDMAARQERLDSFEEATAGYAVHNMYIQYALEGERIHHQFSVNLENIFDKSYRNHLSRIKTILPEPGRNIRLLYRLYF